jgi:hypothetical protein
VIADQLPGKRYSNGQARSYSSGVTVIVGVIEQLALLGLYHLKTHCAKNTDPKLL